MAIYSLVATLTLIFRGRLDGDYFRLAARPAPLPAPVDVIVLIVGAAAEPLEDPPDGVGGALPEGEAEEHAQRAAHRSQDGAEVVHVVLSLYDRLRNSNV